MLAESKPLTITADELAVALTCRPVHNLSLLNKVQLGFTKLDPLEQIYKRPASSWQRYPTLCEKRTDDTPCGFVHSLYGVWFSVWILSQQTSFCLSHSLHPGLCHSSHQVSMSNTDSEKDELSTHPGQVMYFTGTRKNLSNRLESI